MKTSIQEIIATTTSARVQQLAENVMANNALMKLLKRHPYKKYRPTELDRIKERIQRIKDATAVLQGKARAVYGDDE